MPAEPNDSFDNLVDEIGKTAALEILAMFIRETEARLARMRQLSVTADTTTVEREAHTLKSAAATFDLHPLAALAREMEREAARLSEDDYAILLQRAEAAFATGRTRYASGDFVPAASA